MFKEGQKVAWTSQSGGYVKDKVGVVAQVVPAKGYPDRDRFLHLYKSAGVGLCRDHESYVVLVGKRPYWPRVSHLKAVK
ncbi:hypothetical protein METEAL_21020 [Mesoterricola silvestris]|uniref:Uncharacterized protein n=2 Tax=Mesoterricola silvestris TaxID=2927979 RepID=A0AA48GYY1_9BACT|nr:hypothetical protein METEAL_21020 [Mesoterricola silvestris]